jgi:hypothetical protein
MKKNALEKVDEKTIWQFVIGRIEFLINFTMMNIFLFLAVG